MKRPACLVKDLAEVMVDGKSDVLEGKIRPGEKIYETLVQEDEMRRAIEEDEYYVICPHGTEGVPKLRRELFEYTSQTTRRLSKEELRLMLEKDGWL